jgi:hypothetical protein
MYFLLSGTVGIWETRLGNNQFGECKLWHLTSLLASCQKPNLRSIDAKGAWTIIWVDRNLSNRSNNSMRYRAYLLCSLRIWFYRNIPNDEIAGHVTKAIHQIYETLYLLSFFPGLNVSSVQSVIAQIPVSVVRWPVYTSTTVCPRKLCLHVGGGCRCPSPFLRQS